MIVVKQGALAHPSGRDPHLWALRSGRQTFCGHCRKFFAEGEEGIIFPRELINKITNRYACYNKGCFDFVLTGEGLEQHWEWVDDKPLSEVLKEKLEAPQQSKYSEAPQQTGFEYAYKQSGVKADIDNLISLIPRPEDFRPQLKYAIQQLRKSLQTFSAMV